MMQFVMRVFHVTQVVMSNSVILSIILICVQSLVKSMIEKEADACLSQRDLTFVKTKWI